MQSDQIVNAVNAANKFLAYTNISLLAKMCI